MPLSDADLAATPIDDGSFISDSDKPPYSRPGLGHNQRSYGPLSRSRGLYSNRPLGQPASGPNTNSPIITLERFREYRIKASLAGTAVGTIAGGSVVYTLTKAYPRRMTNNRLTLTFCLTFFVTSTLAFNVMFKTKLHELQMQARAAAIARGEIPDPNSPDRLFDTSGVGDSPSWSDSPEEVVWSEFGSGGVEGQPGYERGTPTVQAPWRRGPAAQQDQEAQGSQEQQPMSWAERQRRAQAIPEDLCKEIARLRAGNSPVEYNPEEYSRRRREALVRGG